MRPSILTVTIRERHHDEAQLMAIPFLGPMKDLEVLGSRPKGWLRLEPSVHDSEA